MNHIEFLRTPVDSAVLSSIGYSSDTTLELEFRSGATYRYFAVPPTVVQGLVEAESKGTFLNRNVRNHFRYQRLL